MNEHNEENARPTGLDDDVRLSAFALGELEGEERDEMARRVAADPVLRAVVDELRSVAAELEAALAGDSAQEMAGLTEPQRIAVTARAALKDGAHLMDARRRSMERDGVWAKATRTWRWVGLAAVAGLVGVIGVAVRQQSAMVEVGEKTRIPQTQGMGARPRATNSVQYVARSGATTSSATLDLSAYVAQGANLTPASETRAVAEPLADPSFLPFEADDDKVLGDLEEAEEQSDEVPVSREGYDRIVDNPFVATSQDRLSTFSIDVDTASYTNVRRMLQAGEGVPPDAVRIEELVNYFDYGYAAPEAGSTRPFAVHTAVTAAPWAPAHRIVRIGLRATDIDLAERPASNLVFLLDVSGSMDDPAKLPLVKRALALLVEQLDERDRVAIVVYAGSQGLALEATPGSAQEAILQALERLAAGGSTNGGAGIQLAYETAREGFIEGGINRVLLCTDGDFNVGVSSDGDLERLIEREAQSGVFLTVLGFGSGNWQDAKMEKLSNRGNGNFAYIDSLLEARRVLVEELGGTLVTVAKDVKIQVEFNPAEVQAARLIGYENRVLEHQDFLDDTKDAGEIGAGHTVTALYEVIPVGVVYEAPPVPPSRYAAVPQTAGPATTGPVTGVASGALLTVRLRYKAPDGDVSTGFEVPVIDGGDNQFQADDDLRFAAAVAAFGMVLRGSEHVGKATLDDVRSWALEALGNDEGGRRAGFLELVDLALEQRRR